MITDLNSLKNEIARLRKENPQIKIVTTNGSFDILHAGHVYILEKAKSFGDMLIVLLNSDESVKRFKGNKRPIIPERERTEILSSLKSVDHVLIFDDDDPLRILSQIKPDIHIKGGSFIKRRIDEEKRLVESWGGEFRNLPLKEGHSTTDIIDQILKKYKEK